MELTIGAYIGNGSLKQFRDVKIEFFDGGQLGDFIVWPNKARLVRFSKTILTRGQ